MRLLVSGTRDGSGAICDKVWETLDKFRSKFGNDLFLILGDASGVDSYARRWATQHKVDHCILYARWKEEGNKAGIKRNLRMFMEEPEAVLAFPSNESKGTLHVIDTADKLEMQRTVYEV